MVLEYNYFFEDGVTKFVQGNRQYRSYKKSLWERGNQWEFYKTGKNNETSDNNTIKKFLIVHRKVKKLSKRKAMSLDMQSRSKKSKIRSQSNKRSCKERQKVLINRIQVTKICLYIRRSSKKHARKQRHRRTRQYWRHQRHNKYNKK